VRGIEKQWDDEWVRFGGVRGDLWWCVMPPRIFPLVHPRVIAFAC
jgi:hypothetical protein